MKTLLLASTALFAIMCMLMNPTTASPAKRSKSLVYIGTFRGETSKGIYAFRFDSSSGELDPLGLAAAASRPLFLAVHPNHRFLYAVSRPNPVDRQHIGVVLAYAIDFATGKLTELNSLPSRGIDPAYLSVDQKGENLLVANFGSNSGGGNVSVFPIKQDGSLAEASDFVQFSGTGVHPQRQQGPHSHAINASPDNRFVFVADLGLDKLFVYSFDSRHGKLTPNNPAFAALQPGSGPRHIVFHPSGRFLYVISEIHSTITTFAYSRRAGELKELQTITTLPPDFKGTSSAAEVQIHPQGKYLYASNRGHDSIAVFAIDPNAGTLTLIELVPAQGKTPGTFAIDPGGSWLLAANQASDSLVLFRLDPNSGKLQAAGRSLTVGTPSCVRFVP
jgi:6-phosphogluconolactonase